METEQFGQYRLEQLIGRGGMGEVYRAYDTVRERQVALKRLPPHLAADAEFQARFRKESALASRLSEAHIVPIHDFGEIDGRLYIDMRLVDGRDLSAVLQQDGPLAPDRAAAVVAQVASALDAAHADGLVHRDVKPSNVLLTGRPGREFVYLVDFGIARSMGAGGGTSLTGAGATVGTLGYMAPERFLETTSDNRADIYALGCVLFEVLTGHRPFRSDSMPAMIHAHLNLAPPRPSRERPGLTTELDGVVARSMAKRPEDRFQSAGELADAVLAVLGGRLAVSSAAPTVFDAAGRQALTQVPPAGFPVGYRPPHPQPGRPSSHPVTGPPGGMFPRPGPGPPPQARRRRWPLVAAAVAAVVVLAAGVVLGGRLLAGRTTPGADDGPTSTSTSATPTSTTPSATPTTAPSLVRPVSVSGGDPVADQALWDSVVGGTGVDWAGGCRFLEPFPLNLSTLSCDTVDPATAYTLLLESYASESDVLSALDGQASNAAGEPGGCDVGGRFDGQVLGREVACGTYFFDDGESYYEISWSEPGTLRLATVGDSDPARAWQWFIAHDPI